MKIVVLDHVFFTEKQVEELKTFGEVIFYDATRTEQEAIERLKGADIAIADTFLCPLNKSVLESTDNLKFLALNTTGYDAVDLEASKQKGIKVSNLPGFSTQAVAEQVFALLFAVARKIAMSDKKMREKPFEIDPSDNLYNQFIGTELHGKTLGIVGLGAIGIRVAEIAHGLEMKVLAFNRSKKDVSNVNFVSLEELLKESDFVTVHLALAPETENFFSAERFKQMKTESIFINVARGKHVDGKALIEALKIGEIAGAGLDVLPSEYEELLTMDNVVLTPHSAFFTGESLENLARMIVENVKAFINGSPVNLVSD